MVKPTRCTNFSSLFYFGITLYMFWTVFPSIISSGLYIQQQVYQTGTVVCLLATASKQTTVPVWHIPVAVCTVLNSWWWTERPSKTCRVLFQNKINLTNIGFTIEVASWSLQNAVYFMYFHECGTSPGCAASLWTWKMAPRKHCYLWQNSIWMWCELDWKGSY